MSNFDFGITAIKPFGPILLQAKCPDVLLNTINQYVDSVFDDQEKIKNLTTREKNIPNLLLRDIENIYFTKEYCDSIGLTEFVETLGDLYMDYSGETGKTSLACITNKTDAAFKNPDIVYADLWVNSYYSGDFTPYHIHGSDISGVIFLKLSDALFKEQRKDRFSSEGFWDGDYTEDDEELLKREFNDAGRLNGNLQFVYGPGYKFAENHYEPDQEVGKILLFPSWLTHLVYPQRNNQERRTLSFNLKVGLHD